MQTLTTAPSICDLITSLKAAFDAADISDAERILFSWADSLKSELSNNLSDDFLLMAVEKTELELRISHLEKELDLCRKENATLREQKSALEISVTNLENQMEVVKKENVSFKEKIMAMSKIVEENQLQRDLPEKGGKIGDGFVNKTPIKRAFRAHFSDSEGDSDDNVPIGVALNIKPINLAEEGTMVLKNGGSRKRRLVRAGEIGCHRISTIITGSDEKCSMDDFSDTEGFGASEMSKSDSSARPFTRKLSYRKRDRKLNFSDTEEEEHDNVGPKSDAQLNESKYDDTLPTGKFVPVNKYINLDNSGSEEVVDTKSDSEDDSLDEFIVSGSEPESDDDPEPPNSIIEPNSDDETLGDVLKKIKREKNNSGKKWECEAEMLADFGRKPDLCLNAVCALYRQQTEEEQDIKSTFVLNKRGFSQADAPRGSEIARFLTDDDPWAPLKKTVNDLQEHDSFALDVCEVLAKRYSKQLFEIYHCNEDPFFNPSMFDSN